MWRSGSNSSSAELLLGPGLVASGGGYGLECFRSCVEQEHTAVVLGSGVLDSGEMEDAGLGGHGLAEWEFSFGCSGYGGDEQLLGFCFCWELWVAMVGEGLKVG